LRVEPSISVEGRNDRVGDELLIFIKEFKCSDWGEVGTDWLNEIGSFFALKLKEIWIDGSRVRGAT
jgi:hypothetical protein